MKICYFGDYDSEYARNRVMMKGLRENNVEVLECRSKSGGWRKYIDLLRAHRKIGNYEFMIVGYSDSRLIVPFAKILNRGKFLIWDAFYSLYDSWVFDRKLTNPGTIRARCYWVIEWVALKSANKVLLDTFSHIDYFVKTYKIHKNKFIRIPVGTDDSVFYPRSMKRESDSDKTNILFCGKFIPLQGVKYIIKAAKSLEDHSDISFTIIGEGQTYVEVRKLAKRLEVKNVEFINIVPYQKLPNYIEKADIVLGIFGDTGKTLRVIPNKVYETIAMAKPVITGSTPAIKEIFEDHKNILLCKVADEQDLARKIVQLKEDKFLRESIASGGYEIFDKEIKPRVITKNLLKTIDHTGL